MVTKTEGLITIYDELGTLIAIVLKDEKSRKNIFYNTNEMGFEEIRLLLDTNLCHYQTATSGKLGPNGLISSTEQKKMSLSKEG